MMVDKEPVKATRKEIDEPVLKKAEEMRSNAEGPKVIIDHKVTGKEGQNQ